MEPVSAHPSIIDAAVPVANDARQARPHPCSRRGVVMLSQPVIAPKASKTLLSSQLWCKGCHTRHPPSNAVTTRKPLVNTYLNLLLATAPVTAAATAAAAVAAASSASRIGCRSYLETLAAGTSTVSLVNIQHGCHHDTPQGQVNRLRHDWERMKNNGIVLSSRRGQRCLCTRRCSPLIQCQRIT